MKNAVVVALVVIVSVAGGYLLGRQPLGDGDLVVPNLNPKNGLLMTQSFGRGGIVLWQMKDGRPVDVRAYNPPTAEQEQTGDKSIRVIVYDVPSN